MSIRELTATAPGAVRILELLEDTCGRLAELFSRSLPEPGEIAFGRLKVDGDTLDEVLVVTRASGALEVHLHGSEAVVASVQAALGAEAVTASTHDLLVRARTEAAARVALDRLEGSLERELKRFDGSPSEDAWLDELLATGAWGPDLFVPRRVVLAGPTNAGKSTLFNALVGTDRVLTSDVAGTTRDAIRETFDAGGFPIELLDTAGWREILDEGPAADVERAGQQRGRALGQTADLVLWATSAPGDVAPPAGARILGLQADRVQHPEDRLAISALKDPDGAREALVNVLREAFGWPEEPWLAGRAVLVDSNELEALAQARGVAGMARKEHIESLRSRIARDRLIRGAGALPFDA